MLVACRLAGPSALEGHYAGLNARTQFEPTQRPRDKPMRQRRTGGLSNFNRSGRNGGPVQAGGAGTALNFPDSGPAGHHPPAVIAKPVFSPNAALSAGLSADGRESVAGQCVQTPFIGNGLRRP
jgi:hypothetical protein